MVIDLVKDSIRIVLAVATVTDFDHRLKTSTIFAHLHLPGSSFYFQFYVLRTLKMKMAV